MCSPIIAQAILESASGTSELAKNAHNYFGLKYRAGRCPSACGVYYKVGSEQNKDGTYVSSNMQWTKFSTMDAGIKGYFDFINISNYSNLKGVSDPQTYLENIKKDGYATSINYVQNNMNVINKYNLTKYDIKTEVTEPMSLNIKTNLANRNNYGASRNTSTIKYLVIHYTANDGDTDEANGKYFANNVVKSSAHYFVDDDSITQSVPDNYIAYHCGATKYYHAQCRNANSIGIEMCDTKKNGMHDVTERTLQNTITLAKSIMQKYNIPISNVLRHYDVTHKNCPAYFVSDANAWNNFKNSLCGLSGNIQIPSSSTPPSTSISNGLYRVRKSWSDTSSQIGAYNSLDNAKANCKSGYYVFDDKGNIVYPVSNQSSSNFSSLVKIGLTHAKNFTEVDDSNNVAKAKGRVLQRALNLDYGKSIAEDGDIGTKSKNKLGSHYVKKGEKQYMVTAAEILMYLNNIDPNGIELPGTYGNGLVNAAKIKFGGNGQKITASNFLTLVKQ